MYKNKELMSILDIMNDYPDIVPANLKSKIKCAISVKKPPKISMKEKEVLANLYAEIIRSDKVYLLGQKALEEILGIPRFEEKYHEIEIYDEEDFWEAVAEESEELEAGTYGFRTEKTAFNSAAEPASVFLVKYKEKYIVYTSDEYDGSGDAIDDLNFLEHDIFDDYEKAYKYYQSLLGRGFLSGKEQIKNCKAELDEPDLIYIKARVGIYDNANFSIYYRGMLIMEHAGRLDPRKINQAVIDFKNFCISNNLQINEIRKERPWNSNQRYYVISLYKDNYDENIIYVHIPSSLQGRERNVVDLIQPNNIVPRMY